MAEKNPANVKLVEKKPFKLEKFPKNGQKKNVRCFNNCINKITKSIKEKSWKISWEPLKT